MRSSATAPTANARRYMIQLCKHFGHRLTTRFDDREGQLSFPGGEVRLRATPETLLLRAEAPEPADLERLEDVIARHLKRFAFREPDLAVDWRRGA